MSALNPSQKCNWWQTPEQRRVKYQLAKSMGANPYLAQRLRDWSLRKIERFFGIQPKNLDMGPDGRIRQLNSV